MHSLLTKLLTILAGGLFGAGTGLVLGFLWVEIDHVSNFEGVSGYAVFSMFYGAIAGAASAEGRLIWKARREE